MADVSLHKISNGMKVALVHDFLMYWGGAERLLKGLAAIFPGAPLYTLFYKSAFVHEFFSHSPIILSSLQNLPLPHRSLLPLMPFSIESFQFDEFDVVISSGIFAKGIITRPGTRHIHYCHTPPRFLWEESASYLQHSVPFGLKTLTLGLLHWLRQWDVSAASRPDIMIANSRWTQQKIKKIYRREAEVVYPFTSSKFKVQKSKLQSKTQKYFLVVSRLQRYKNIDVAIRACNDLRLNLIIAGLGSDEKRLRRLAGPNIEFLGFIPEEKLSSLYQHARAVIVPNIEDFGLVAIEAMAHGTPVIAYRKGGAVETIIEGRTGKFFDQLSEKALIESIAIFMKEEKKYDKELIKKHSEQFSFKHFEEKILTITCT